ncbi:PadR family transcriptional regulator [Halarchaeum nitratireducens]|uniref:PadR family transcriptional regulator n=1 Tax=Halarchaeum nitratireducens TaxID=489913 RepID=UPI0016639F71|nr:MULTISPECIES: PadR family transcriptional regulator [Halarchaeum]MBP2252411.1 DNA-binding PadR family transcriptional regulator [Halarchaeum solikamskense]
MNVRLTPEQRSEVLLSRVQSVLFDDEAFQFRESLVKQNLDEILLLLVAHRSADTHGKGLMTDLVTVFDTHLSPGTVYPRLHDLESDGYLDVQELVRTKEYQVAHTDALVERITAAMEQHLALGLFFRAALDDLD